MTEQDVEIRDIKPQASVAIPEHDAVYRRWSAALSGVLAVLRGWLIYRKRTERNGCRQSHAWTRSQPTNWPASADCTGPGRRIHGTLRTGYDLSLYVHRTPVSRAALEQTTSELKRTLRTTPMSEPLARSYIELFADCDLVKFADFKPSVNGGQLMARVDQAR